jgi:hypothetical protein
MTGVRIYDPAESITYRHTAPGAQDNYRTRVLARLRHARAVDSVSVVRYRTGERAARDPLTGATVRWIDPVDRAWHGPNAGDAR